MYRYSTLADIESFSNKELSIQDWNKSQKTWAYPIWKEQGILKIFYYRLFHHKYSAFCISKVIWLEENMSFSIWRTLFWCQLSQRITFLKHRISLILYCYTHPTGTVHCPSNELKLEHTSAKVRDYFRKISQNISIVQSTTLCIQILTRKSQSTNQTMVTFDRLTDCKYWTDLATE